MRRHWSGVIRLIAIIAGLGAGIWEKFVLGGGWIPAMTLMILFFLAIPAIISVVREAAGRLMEWREINLRSGTLDGLAPMDTGHRPMTPPRRFPPPWRVVEMPGGYAVEDATGQQLGVFYGSGAARTLRAGSGPHHGRGAAHGGEFRATSGTAERCQRGRVISSLYACMSRCL